MFINGTHKLNLLQEEIEKKVQVLIFSHIDHSENMGSGRAFLTLKASFIMLKACMLLDAALGYTDCSCL